MEGNRGLLYVRVMRTPVRRALRPRLRLRVRHEATSCATSAADARRHRQQRARRARGAGGGGGSARARGIGVGVVDMPSIDEDLLLALVRVGQADLSSPNRTTATSCRISSRCCTAAARRSRRRWQRVMAINTLDADGRPHFIHSGTYEELIEAFGLTPAHDRRRDRDARAGEAAMSVPAIHEDDVEELGPAGPPAALARSAPDAHAGRALFGVRDPRARPANKVRPAHSHPNGEEVIYIISGSGRVLVGGEVQAGRGGHDGAVSAGRRAHAPQHRRRGDEGRLLLRAGDDLDNYKMHEGVDFPD